MEFWKLRIVVMSQLSWLDWVFSRSSLRNQQIVTLCRRNDTLGPQPTPYCPSWPSFSPLSLLSIQRATPSPAISLDMHKVLVAQSCQTLCDPMANIKTCRFIGNFSFHCTLRNQDWKLKVMEMVHEKEKKKRWLIGLYHFNQHAHNQWLQSKLLWQVVIELIQWRVLSYLKWLR